jgi:hypothetical protein
MKATITDIDQSYSLATGRVSNFLIFQLPSGQKIRAHIGDEDAQTVITESRTQASPAPRSQGIAYDPDNPRPDFEHEDFGGLDMSVVDGEPTKTPVNGGYDPLGPEPTKHVNEGMLDWTRLPDTQLPPQMKQILKASRIPPMISYDDLQALKGQILERMRDKPQAGKVDWNGGPRRSGSGIPIRTVPMDEKGNPMPPGGIIEADPGEGPDEDDDGVAQA